MTDSPARCPVRDWASDYDIFDPDYVRDPAPVWKELRERCPIAHTERWGGSWLPTRYEHLQKMVKMVPALSSASPLVVPPSPEMIEILEAETEKHGETSRTPPITSDPPRHRPYRRIIMPLFSPHAVEKHIPYTRHATRDTRHATRDTRHATRDTRHATRDTRHATRDTRHATRDTRHATRDTRHATRDTRHATRDTRHATRDTRHATRDTRHATRDTRHATRDTRHATRDTRHATRDTRHATRDTRHATRDTRHATRDTRDLCNGLIDGFIGEGRADAAADYAEQITPRVIAHILGIDPARADEFVTWVRGVLEFGLTEPEQMVEYRTRIRAFFQEMVTERRETPRGDAISMMIASEAEGEKLTDYRILGMCSLLLIAGIDTTWSAISSSLLHFATHPADQARLRAEPELLPTAVEELLRFYSPVTMGRIVTEPVEIDGAEMQEGDRVLLNFPGANRDPEAFERADEVVLDRERNRHMAFGLGIHRCAGSNLARMEMQVALRTWFDRIGEFELADPDAVTWAGGQVRGPRSVPVRFAPD